MASTELDVRTQRTNDALAALNNRDFLAQIERLLPDNVPLRKFVQVAATAIRQTPDLVNADQTTLFAAIIRCAQDGLMPDGREAALVAYSGKVSYLPMIDGIAKTLAEFGWLLRTNVVYENDDFDYSDEPAAISHRSVRPGAERGDLAAAYAIATHRDGRRLQRVLHPDEIAQRRAKAQTQNVWNEWPAAMWRKSAGHAVAGDVPLSEGDRARLDRMVAPDLDPGAAAELLYGPGGDRFLTTPAPPVDGVPASEEPPPAEGDAALGGTGRQAAAAVAKPSPASPAAAAVPDAGEPEPQPAAATNEATETAAAAGAQQFPSGTAYQGMSLQEVADLGEDGAVYLAWALRNPTKLNDGFHATVLVYVEAAMPELWASYIEWREARAAA